MSDVLKLNVLSPERKLVEGQVVTQVTLPGSEGQIQILPGHAAMLGTLHTGIFAFQARSGAGTESTVSGVLSTGFFEVVDDTVTVMAETLELAGEIDVSRAKKAQEKAETVLREADLDEHRFGKYQLKLQRALIRQQAVGKSTH